MVCLDTSVLIPLLRRDAAVMARVQSLQDRGVRVSTTPISICELYSGAYGARHPAQEVQKVATLVNALDVLALDAASCQRYGELANHPDLVREPIGDLDLLIAAIALRHQEWLATRNPGHFRRVPGLVTEHW